MRTRDAMQLPQWAFGRPVWGSMSSSGCGCYSDELQNTVSVSLGDEVDDVAFLRALEQQRSLREATKKRWRQIGECLPIARMSVCIADTGGAHGQCNYAI